MIEQVADNIYRIEIPLPQSPLKATNSYFIRGDQRNLLIDTGFNRLECRVAMEAAQRMIGFTMENTDLFLTHVHADHTGLAGNLCNAGMRVYAGGFFEDYYTNPSAYDDGEFSTMILQSGLAQMGLSPEDQSVHPGYEFAPAAIRNLNIIKDGDILSVGDLHLRCIETQGHTPDHFCLYVEESQIMFTGDHILGSITPNNTLWEDPWDAKNDYLGLYLENLDKLSNLPITMALPGHRGTIQDCHKRIDELKMHHEQRLNLILEILDGNASYTGAQVAKRMRWEIKAKSWEEFPTAQKIFATGEALSHLTHLIFRGELYKELKDGVVYYSKIK